MAWNEPGGNGNKDPWGNPKNEQGPPDLDEIVSKMRAKLSGWFGGGQTNNDEEGWNWQIIGVILLAFLFVWAQFGWYVIQPAERGVETRFGSYLRMTDQGLNWHWPYPIDSVQKVNVEQVQAVTHKALMLTQDENIVEIEVTVQYRVNEASDYLFKVREPDKTLQHVTESALREVVGTSKMDDVLTKERDRVAADTKTRVQTILDRYGTGLSVVRVTMQDAQPPAEVQEDFADVIRAREDEVRLKNKAEAYTNEVVQRAGGTADKLRQEAYAYKTQVIARAEGQTQRFLNVLSEYEKAPEITRKRLYLEAMEIVLANTNKIMLDVQGSNNLMVLPLDRLLNQAATTPALATTATPAAVVPPSSTTPSRPTTTEEDKRNRDDARSRGNR